MSATVTETCACGASFTIRADTYTALKYSLTEWRSGHRHEPAGDPTGTHVAEVEASVTGGRSLTAESPRRLAECVARWPEAETGQYDPRCCRFPKSCSADVYDEDRVAESDLEPAVPPAP